MKFGQSMQFEVDDLGGNPALAPKISWDFGDGQVYDGAKVQHTFPATQTKALVVVRATNPDGIWVESGTQLQNQLLAQKTALSTLGSNSSTGVGKQAPSQLKYVLIVVLVMLLIVGAIRFWKNKRVAQTATNSPLLD